jgi:hypothetical protein
MTDSHSTEPRMDVDRLLPLAPRDLLILSILLEGPRHGYGIDAITRTGEAVLRAAVTRLARLLRHVRRALVWRKPA